MNTEILLAAQSQRDEDRFCLLESIHDSKYPQDNRWSERFMRFSDFKRMIYWADQPDGGIGVSFVDPVEYCRIVHCTTDFGNAGFLCGNRPTCDGNSQDHILDELLNGAKVISISSDATSDIGRELFTKSREALQSYRWHWHSAYQRDGDRVDDVLIGWSLPEPPPNIDWEGNPIYNEGDLCGYDAYPYDAFDSAKEPHSDMIPNVFSNVPFNYAFLHSIVSDDLLSQEIARYKFFTDGQLVDMRFGYYSPAYALALLQSLQKRDLVNVALRSYSNFAHYHPIDPITTLCDRIARRAFQGVVCGHEIKSARDMRHHYSMIDRYVESEEDERDYKRLQCESDAYD